MGYSISSIGAPMNLVLINWFFLNFIFPILKPYPQNHQIWIIIHRLEQIDHIFLFYNSQRIPNIYPVRSRHCRMISSKVLHPKMELFLKCFLPQAEVDSLLCACGATSWPLVTPSCSSASPELSQLLTCSMFLPIGHNVRELMVVATTPGNLIADLPVGRTKTCNACVSDVVS
jgi:hypothetical protein